jgi:hypothetical protein
MRRATALILLIGFCAACNFDFLTSDFCPLAQNGQCSGQGNGIKYVLESVSINRGGVLEPGTMKTAMATPNQRPAVRWTNQDTVSHHLVFDADGFDTGGIAPTGDATLVFDS